MFRLLTLLAAALHMEDPGPVAPSDYVRFYVQQDILRIIPFYLPSDPVIVEAGAYDGNDSSALAKFWPDGHVHCFEPVTSLFERLSGRVATIPNATPYRLALGKESGKATFYLSEELQHPDEITESSSLFPPKDHSVLEPTTFFDKTEEVDVTTIDDWAELNGIERVDLLWLDLQGYELATLKASPKILENVSVIMTEVEFVEAYEGQPLYYEVKQWLENQGFTMIGGNFDFPKSPHQWFGDALFVRNELIEY